MPRQDSAEDIIAWLNSDESEQWRHARFHRIAHSGGGPTGVSFASIKSFIYDEFDGAMSTIPVNVISKNATGLWRDFKWEPDADPTRI